MALSFVNYTNKLRLPYISSSSTISKSKTPGIHFLHSLNNPFFMGNYTSCANLALHLNQPKSARVILPGGQIRQFHHPVKAADLMLDHPAYFLSNTDSLNIGHRFSPLSADQDLQFGNLYVMLPMRRVNSIVTAADAAVFVMATPAAGANALKVSPEAAAEPMTEDLGSENGWSRLRLEYKSRASRKPLLDTITEEPSFFIFLT